MTTRAIHRTAGERKGSRCAIRRTNGPKRGSTSLRQRRNQAIVPAPKNVPKLTPLDYTRQKDRPTERGNGHAASKDDLDDDIPFMWLMPMILHLLMAFGSGVLSA